MGGIHHLKSLLLFPYPAIPPYAVRTPHPGSTDDREYITSIRCTQVYPGVPRCTQVHPGVPRCTQVYCTQVYPGVPGCTHVYPGVPRGTRGYPGVPTCTQQVYSGGVPRCPRHEHFLYENKKFENRKNNFDLRHGCLYRESLYENAKSLSVSIL